MTRVSLALGRLMFAPETFHDLIISSNAGVGMGKDLLSLPSFISSDKWDPLKWQITMGKAPGATTKVDCITL